MSNNNNEIISFQEEKQNTQNKPAKDKIDIDKILKKEDELLKLNNKKLDIRKLDKISETKIEGISLREDNEEKNEPIPEGARETSRRNYLNKRVNQQLDLFKRRIIDEYNIFQDIKLTKEEINNNRLNNKIYNLINKNLDNKKETTKEKKNKYDNVELVQRYTFKREEPEYQRKFNKKTKRNFNNSNDFKETSESLWEKEQRKKAIQKYGNNSITKDKYNILIENQMDFIKQDLLESENIPLIKENKDNFRLKDVNNFISERDYKIGSMNLKKKKKLIKNQIQQEKQNLPIYEYKQEILKLIKDKKILIIEGETGSGKTTQIPQYLYENGFCDNNKKICVTQPRRVAALSVASRVAYEMGVKCGHELGYSIRFEENVSPMTKIIYMTDGIFLRYLLSDNLLNEFSVIMIDEAHERSIQTDIIFGIIKTLIEKREDLRIIISSATLSTLKFKNYFSEAEIIKVPGRRFPVDIYYTKSPEPDYIEAAVITSLQIHISQAEELFDDDNSGGDILVFLTGQEEIELAKRMINNQIKKLRGKIPNCVVLPIYAALPSEEQAKIFMPVSKGERKIILATNIAETSITINGIGYVIDSGFCKQMCYDPRTGLETLAVTPISKANANQRAGRAGRVRPGKEQDVQEEFVQGNVLDYILQALFRMN